MLSSRTRRRSAGAMMLAGVGAISLDQRFGRVILRPSGQALAGDWEAVGGDIRRALKQVRDEVEAA